jgi:Gpi16 subunit, GPI transamidase component
MRAKHVMNARALQEPYEQRWLAELACRGTHERHASTVVVSMATPDFSMPYIVCALSSSLLAVYAGLVITTMTERRRHLAVRALSKAGRRAKAFKLIVVVVVFLALVPYLDTEWRDWLEAQLKAFGVQL